MLLSSSATPVLPFQNKSRRECGSARGSATWCPAPGMAPRSRTNAHWGFASFCFSFPSEMSHFQRNSARSREAGFCLNSLFNRTGLQSEFAPLLNMQCRNLGIQTTKKSTPQPWLKWIIMRHLWDYFQEWEKQHMSPKMLRAVQFCQFYHASPICWLETQLWESSASTWIWILT